MIPCLGPGTSGSGASGLVSLARLWVNYDSNYAIHNFWKGSLLRQYENTGYCYNQDAASKINLMNKFSHATDVGVPVPSSDEYRAKIFVQEFSFFCR